MYYSKEDQQAEGTTTVPVSFAWVLAIGVVLIASLTFLPDMIYRLI